MRKNDMEREIRTLASGTLANLFGTARYDQQEACQVLWLEWVQTQPDDKTWETWQDCWDEYKRNEERLHTERRLYNQEMRAKMGDDD